MKYKKNRKKSETAKNINKFGKNLEKSETGDNIKKAFNKVFKL